MAQQPFRLGGMFGRPFGAAPMMGGMRKPTVNPWQPTGQGLSKWGEGGGLSAAPGIGMGQATMGQLGKPMGGMVSSQSTPFYGAKPTSGSPLPRDSGGLGGALSGANFGQGGVSNFGGIFGGPQRQQSPIDLASLLRLYGIGMPRR